MNAGSDFPGAQRTILPLCALLCAALVACHEAKEDIVDCAEDGNVTIDVLANDGPRGHLESYLASQANHGFAGTEGDHVVYKPYENFQGEDSFEYEVSWAIGGSQRVRVTVHVTPDEPPSTAHEFPLPFAAHNLAMLDVDADGNTDILATDRRGNISLLRDTGDAPRNYEVSGRELAFGPNRTSGQLGLVVADWNRDGADDAIIMGLYDVGHLALLGPATAAGELAEVQLTALSDDPIFMGGTAIAGDFDGDGEPDLIAQSAWDSSAPLVLFSDFRVEGSSVSFAARTELDASSAGRPVRVDANGDDCDDLLITNDDVELWLCSPSGLELARSLRTRLDDVIILGGSYPEFTLIAEQNFELVAATSLEGPFDRLGISSRGTRDALRLRSGTVLVAPGEYTLVDFYGVNTSKSVQLTFIGDLARDIGIPTDLAAHDLDGDGYDELLIAREIWNPQTGEHTAPALTVRQF